MRNSREDCPTGAVSGDIEWLVLLDATGITSTLVNERGPMPVTGHKIDPDVRR